jgi:hypothetical protein
MQKICLNFDPVTEIKVTQNRDNAILELIFCMEYPLTATNSAEPPLGNIGSHYIRKSSVREKYIIAENTTSNCYLTILRHVAT